MESHDAEFNDWERPVPDDRPGARSQLCPEGYVWLGDLSGWEVGIMRHRDGWEAVCLYHRCGWAQPLRPCGIASDHGVFLANIVELALEVLPGHQCAAGRPVVADDDATMRAAREVLREAMADVYDRPAPSCCEHVTCRGDGPCGYIMAGLVDGSVRCDCTGAGR